jgi:hypothetical protein
MNILPKSEHAFVRVNQPQPDQFPRFYIIPETKYVPRRQRACNAHQYHQPPSLTPISPSTESAFRKYVRIEMEVFQEACADAWAAIKALGRAIVRWLARWVVLPLSVASALHIPAIHPMDLPI